MACLKPWPPYHPAMRSRQPSETHGACGLDEVWMTMHLADCRADGPPWVIHDRCIQYPCRSMSVVTCRLKWSMQHKHRSAWGCKSQSLAWSFVELPSHFVELGLRVHGQVSPLRQVLPQQTVGVLIGITLPRTLRIAEVNVDVGRQRQAPMVRKLLAGSQVSDLYSSFGIVFACLISAETTVWVSLLATFANVT